MSLGAAWFTEEEKRKREARYPSYTGEDWLRALSRYWGTVWPIGEEAAKWLRNNKTADQILDEYGFEVLDLFAQITADPKAQNLAAERYAQAKALADEVGLKNDEQTHEIDNLRRRIAATSDRLEETEGQVSRLESELRRSQEQAEAEIKERVIKSDIQRIEARCRLVAGGAYLGSLVTLSFIWVWLTWKPWFAPTDVRDYIGNLIAVVAVVLPFPGVFTVLWIEGILTNRYKKSIKGL